MQERTIGLRAIALLAFCVTLSLAADQKPPVFYFGGKRLFVGMPKSEAVASLSACCKLSPPADSENEKLSADTGQMVGHFILSRGEAPQRILGGIFFAGGKVARINRPLAEEDFNPQSDDVVAFARALDRALSPTTGDSHAIVFVSVRHERVSNAESEVLSLSFPNGRGVELQIATLDRPPSNAPPEFSKRDGVSLNEILEPPRQQ